jgi:RNA polymerase sigma factor (sigma-70 family)
MQLTEEELTRFIDGLRTGNSTVLGEFLTCYGPTLQRIADKNLSPVVKRRLGPEDIAQSACRSFLRRARGGEFQLDDADGLLRLLCAITLTKVREKTRFHLRQKRGLQFETRFGETQTSGTEPDPAELAEFNDLMAAALAGLDDEERAMLELKLLAHTHDEIAGQLGCSERTVRRILKRIQSNFERLIEA